MVGTLLYPDPTPAWGKDARGLSMRTAFRYTGPGAGAGGYVTGGETLDPNDIKLGTIEWCPAVVAPATTGAATAVIYVYNYTTGKIQAFWQTGAAAAAALPEVDAGTDLSDYTGHFVAEGRG